MVVNVIKIILIYLGCTLVAFISFCSQAEQPKHNAKESIDKISSSPTVKIIDSPNAPNQITRNIRQDKDGNLLIAAFKDIVKFDGKSYTKLKKGKDLDGFDAFDVLEDSKGNIWIASTHQGVFLYDGKELSNFTVKDGLANNRAMSIYEDKAGGIWIATQGGLSFYDGKSLYAKQVQFKSFTNKDGLTSNDINIIIEDRTGKLWVGTRGALSVSEPSILLKSDARKFTEITNNKGKSFTNVWSIIEDRNGDIWLADESGLWRFNNNRFTFYKTPNKIARLYEDKKGSLWFTHSIAGSQKYGLSYYDQQSLLRKKPEATLIHKSNGMLFGIAEDKNGDIWVGTLKGVFRYDGMYVNYFRNGLVKD